MRTDVLETRLAISWLDRLCNGFHFNAPLAFIITSLGNEALFSPLSMRNLWGAV